MRDWSSDVCSSDLVKGEPSLLQPTSRVGDLRATRLPAAQLASDDRQEAVGEPGALGIRVSTHPSAQIGRASCRERV